MYLVIKLGYNVRPTDYKRQRTYAITEQNAQRMGRCVIDRSQLNNGNPEDVSFAEVLTQEDELDGTILQAMLVPVL